MTGRISLNERSEPEKDKHHDGKSRTDREEVNEVSSRCLICRGDGLLSQWNKLVLALDEVVTVRDLQNDRPLGARVITDNDQYWHYEHM